MIEGEHLNLHELQLGRGERWLADSPGLFFAFAKHGEGSSCPPQAPLQLRRGDVWVSSNRLALIAGSTAAFVFWVFSVCLEQLLPLFAVGEISLLDPLADRFKAGRLLPASSYLATECHRLLADALGQDGLGHRAQLLRVAAVVLNDELRAVRSAPNGLDAAQKQLVLSFAKVSTDEFLELPIDELAGRFGCSRRHLNRLFQQYFHTSVAGLRMEMRLLRAVALLRDPQAKVIHVAAECGFNHLGLFNTCFRKRFGASPSEWRRSATTGLKRPARLGRRVFPNPVVNWLPLEVQAAVAACVEGTESIPGALVVSTDSLGRLSHAVADPKRFTITPHERTAASDGLTFKVSLQ